MLNCNRCPGLPGTDKQWQSKTACLTALFTCTSSLHQTLCPETCQTVPALLTGTAKIYTNCMHMRLMMACNCLWELCQPVPLSACQPEQINLAAVFPSRRSQAVRSTFGQGAVYDNCFVLWHCAKNKDWISAASTDACTCRSKRHTQPTP